LDKEKGEVAKGVN